MSTQSKAGKGHPCSPLTTLCIAIALASTGVALPVTYVLADNLPQGGQVIGGKATISQQGNNMDINTSTARTAINWQRFNVGPDNKITFNQPDGKSVTLNRVIGADPSKIYGAITSNGQLILVNPNGIMIGPKAHISSSALVASAGFLTEEQAKQFAATGRLDIQLTGLVSNQGHITVHDNGMVALLGAQVNNAGVIQARKGMVQLATGPKATLDFHGDGLLSIAVNGEPGERSSVNGDVTGGVHNSGEIDVGNGTVAMSAQRAAKHLDSVINVGGNVVADSVSNDGGTIVLGNSARTNVTGNLSAKGVNGGQIKVLGDEVNVAGTAKVDASGTQGAGGKVLVGGSYQGQGPEQAAKNTTVAKGAQLKADGKTDGGQVVVWSDGSTHFAGSASAKGGQKGGVVETSGKQLTVTPEAQVNASGGTQPGKWLLDPETMTVDSSGNPGTISPNTIVDGLKGGDVEIAATNRINVNEAIVAQDAGLHTLRLLADGTAAPVTAYNDTGDPFKDAKRNDSGSVYINAPILLKNGHLYIVATGDVMLNNKTPGVTGDAGYLGRAIIDVGSGTIWIKTSNSGSVIQQEGTALIGNQVGVEGASVLLDSPLNHAGTLAGNASNGKFIYNQTSTGDVNTGTVQITQKGVTESMQGVGSTSISKLGEQWVWEREGSLVHHLTIDEETPFQYLVFEALEYVDHKDHQPIAGDKTNSDYWVKSLTFTNPSTGDKWVISTNTTGQIAVTKNGAPSSELPPGFSFSTDQGQVAFSASGIGIKGGTGDQGNSSASDAINRNGDSGASDKLVVDLGTTATSVDSQMTDLWHSGNKYESGTISFLGNKDTSQSGGVTLKSQKAQLEGQIADAQREYGDANPEFKASVGLAANASDNSKAVKGVDDFVDRQLGQDRFSGVKVTPKTDATPSSNVGDYKIGGDIDASGYAGQRYETTVKDGTLKVTPAELTVTANDKQKTYGDKDPTLDYRIDGNKLGQTGDQLLNDGALSRQAGEDVGKYGINQGGLGLNNGLGGNYTLKFVDGRLEITPAELTVTANDQSKIYGSDDPKLTYKVDGFKFNDSESPLLNGGTLGRTAGEDVGNYAINKGNLALLTDGKGKNYTLKFVEGNLEITPAELTVRADGKTKVYGNPDPTLTYKVVGGLTNGDQLDQLSFSGNLERIAGEDVGDYAINQGGLVLLKDGQGKNYTLKYVGDQLQITPAELTVRADDKSKVYGNPDPNLTYSIISGLKNGDTAGQLSFEGNLVRDSGENVGNYLISQGGLALLSDGQGKNYTLKYVDGNLAITPAELTVTADNQSKIYGSDDPKLTYKVDGFKFNDSENSVLNKGALDRATGQDVGNYAINKGTLALLSDGQGKNYTLKFVEGNLEITPAELTVRADGKTKVYGNPDPTLTYKVVGGLTNSDQLNQLSFSGNLERIAGEDVGDYTINQGGLVLLKDGQGKNYTLKFADGNLAITPAELTVTADNQSKIYGNGNPEFTYKVDGFKYNDSASSVLNGGALDRAAGEDVGNYAINKGALALLTDGKGKNYTLKFVEGNLEITPAELTVSADGKTKVYGNADPTLTYQVVGGLKNGDQAGQLSFGGSLERISGEDVGNYAINQGGLVLLQDGKGKNYTLKFVDGNLQITPAELTLKADDKTKVYGDGDPSLSYAIIAGLKNGDSADQLGFSGNLKRQDGENVGHYGIGQGDLTLLGDGQGKNYTLKFVDGDLQITPATLTVEAQSKSKVYGDADPTHTYKVDGLKRGDSAANVVSGDLARAAGENVGNYAIDKGSVALTSGNYTMVFKEGNLQITPASLEVRADNKSKTAGSADPQLTYQVSGLKNGDNTSVVQGSLARAPGEDAGVYGIGQGQAFQAGSNYTVIFRDGAMTITGPLAPPDPAMPIGPLPVTAQSPGNARCTALESPSAASANYTVSPAVARTYAVQLICKPRAYGDKTSTMPDIRDVLSYANSHFKDGKFIVPDWNRSVIPHDLKVPSKGGK